MVVGDVRLSSLGKEDRMSQRSRGGIPLLLCSWSAFVEQGTVCSPCLPLGLQGFSWGFSQGPRKQQASGQRYLKREKQRG